jgi:hypothetical protein
MPVFVTPYFSFAQNVQPFNLIHLQPNVGYRFSEKLKVTLGTNLLWRARTEDAFYTGANTIGVSADESDARWIGSQTEFSVNWLPTRNFITSLHLVHFSSGEVVDDAGGEDQNDMRMTVHYLFRAPWTSG